MGSELPADWDEVRLGDCGRWLSGGTPSTKNPDLWDGDIPWISGKSLTTHYLRDSDRRVTTLGVANGTRIAPPGSTLMVVRGMSLQTEFRSGIAMRELAFGQDCKAIIPRDGIEPQFLANAVRARAPEILGMVDSSSHGTGRLATELIQALRLGLPSIDEQRAIAEVLGALDDRIEWCAGAVGRLEALLLALARGEAAAVPVDDLGIYVNGGAYTKHATGAGRLVIRIAELSSGVGPSSKYADIEAPQERTAHPGDILFSWSATLDVYRWTADEAIVNQHIFKVLPSEPWPAWFVYAKLKEAMPTFQKIAHDRATTMGHIKRGHLEQVSVGVPDGARLEDVRELGDALWDHHLRVSRERQHLANLRDALLPRLLSGEVRIEDPARVLGTVA